MPFSYPSTEYTIAGYIVGKSTLATKIDAIEAIEAAMLANILALELGGTAVQAMYELDDGQIRIKTGFQTVKELVAGLDALRRVKNIYINQFNGRTFVLQDKRTFR